MLSFIKTTWQWLAAKWTSFEAWVASWMPGLKTYLATGIGAVGSGAAVLQEYITGLPLNEFMTGAQLAIATGVLFTLAFWFRRLGNYNA